MSKSVLVIDTPERCLDCPCHFTGMIRLNPQGKERYIPISCGISDKDIMNNEVKPDWCPLHEIPQKMKRSYFPDMESQVYVSAYNAAIDEILGEKEENERAI